MIRKAFSPAPDGSCPSAPILHPAHRRATLLRKGAAVLQHIPRAWARHKATPEAFAASPPIVVNSLPKSGTYLLMQIAEALPGTRSHGACCALGFLRHSGSLCSGWNFVHCVASELVR